jgi:hypothetical protein
MFKWLPQFVITNIGMQLATIQSRIYEVRGQKVMFDFDLAALYGVETKRLKEAVKRNLKRFPSDFMIRLTQDEFRNLRTQIATSSWGGTRYTPLAFTEQGVSMLSSILNSERAIEVNISIIRTFVLIRQHSLNFRELQDQLKELEKKHNKNFKEIYQALDLLIREKMNREERNKRERIGFKTKSS